MKFDVRAFGKRHVTGDRRAILSAVIYFIDFAKAGEKLTIERVAEISEKCLTRNAPCENQSPSRCSGCRIWREVYSHRF